jgi:hypothetical protein
MKKRSINYTMQIDISTVFSVRLKKDVSYYKCKIFRESDQLYLSPHQIGFWQLKSAKPNSHYCLPYDQL